MSLETINKDIKLKEDALKWELRDIEKTKLIFGIDSVEYYNHRETIDILQKQIIRLEEIKIKNVEL